MKSKQPTVAELESELIRLNFLVRERRQQLARLERCPNKDCECRRVWRDVVEKTLASQMGKISERVKAKPANHGRAGKGKRKQRAMVVS